MHGQRQIHKRDFWAEESLKYTEPHFRLEKSARIVNKIAHGRGCSLLDVGCGPATLMHFLDRKIKYYGIDIAIQDPAPHLLQADLLAEPIKFGQTKFDIVLAQGFFEYVGDFQAQKFSEIRELLTPDGVFVATYVNFGHHDREIYWPYSNIQSIASFRESLKHDFNIIRSFPTSHNWRHSEPGRRFMKASQMHMKVSIPVISPLLAVEYFFICRPADSAPHVS